MPEFVRSKIRNIPDFPKPGIMFKDITTALKDPETFRRIVNFLTEEFKDLGIDYVAGIESRGFIFGAPIAYNLGAGLVIIRKPGKLPAEVEKISYELEYGTDTLEVHKDAIEPGKKVLVVDDLLATGGTALATLELIQKTGGVPAGLGFAIELTFLDGLKRFEHFPNTKIVSMVKY
ncbi:MAG: adenine phosphoribosyltransferase [Candidatus Gastranaerophilales bacterium]|jgi:adenine phosphoribosyltransferase|nr:adenine phosphoribosyltransferase [Candidatus Gastranaerophilales bacterium]